MKRLILWVLLVTLASPLSLLGAPSDALSQARQVVYDYFDLRYQSLNQLQLQPGFVQLFTLSNLTPGAFSEVERLQALITYRQAQSIDLRLADDFSFTLTFRGMEVRGNSVELWVVEEFSFHFLCQPTQPLTGRSEHHFRLTRLANRGWLVSSLDSQDPDGFHALLDSYLAASDGNKSAALAALLEGVRQQDAAWNQHFAQQLAPFPQLMLFRQGQSYAWFGERGAAALEQNQVGSEMLTPILYDAELYLPLRVTVEALGGAVVWDGQGGIQVLINGREMRLHLEHLNYAIDGSDYVLTRPLPLVANRIMLPATLLAEILERQLYLDHEGLAVLARGALPAATQVELQRALAVIYPERFSQVQRFTLP